MLFSLGLVGARATTAATPAGEVYRAAAPGVVRIVSEASERKGSGFLVSRDGLLVTNAHVVGAAERVTVTAPGGPDRVGAVVHRDASVDLALVRIDDASGLRPLHLGTDTAVRVGDPVVAIGAPFGLDRSVSAGIVSGLGRQIPGDDTGTITGAIQTDAALNPGNSGGPLIGADGAVIGVTTRIATRSGTDEGVGFAIPVANVAATIEAEGDGPGGRGYLGIVSVNVDPSIASAEGIPASTAGVLVVRILGDGSALEGGLRLSDVIVAIEGEKVADNAGLTERLSAYGPGEEVVVGVLRDGVEGTHRLVLARRPREA